ncbi:hypothetical protein ACCD06_27735 [Azospirillum sp. CT11-132]|jgi:hypothetical protein|uniref:hypothetical protein n=1 Tax=Azospirillum sp. CT11-132 TaxID=3396317 RepID=UPI0039A45A2D
MLISFRSSPIMGAAMSYDFERERYEERRRLAREARRDYENALEAAQLSPAAGDALAQSMAQSLARWNAAFTNALRIWDQSHDWRLYRL